MWAMLVSNLGYQLFVLEFADNVYTVMALKSYNELDQAAFRLWEELDDVLIKPRTEMPPVHSLKFRENGISTSQVAPDDTIEVSV